MLAKIPLFFDMHRARARIRKLAGIVSGSPKQRTNNDDDEATTSSVSSIPFALQLIEILLAIAKMTKYGNLDLTHDFFSLNIFSCFRA